MSDELSTALVKLKRDEMVEVVRNRIDEGEYPVQVLEECHRGMAIIGQRFQGGECLQEWLCQYSIHTSEYRQIV
jgi:methanogenic corrinoid protein MtbC1